MISVGVTPGLIEVISPYNNEFVSFARMRKAIWSKEKRAWLFDPRDEFAVRSTLIDIFGTDDYESCDKVDVRLNLDNLRCDNPLWMFGLEVAKRKYRDCAVQLGDRVVLVAGGFPSRGGSAKYPQLEPYNGTILELRGVPRPAAEREWLEYPDIVTILGGLNREQLQLELERLKKRIAEIGELLAALDAKEATDPDAIPDLEDCADAAPESSDCQVAH